MKAIWFIFVLSSCSSTPAKIDVTLLNDKGKVAYHVQGTYERGESWMEANLGPVGQVLQGAANLFAAWFPSKVISNP